MDHRTSLMEFVRSFPTVDLGQVIRELIEGLGKLFFGEDSGF